jgi:hypothetical protein
VPWAMYYRAFSPVQLLRRGHHCTGALAPRIERAVDSRVEVPTGPGGLSRCGRSEAPGSDDLDLGWVRTTPALSVGELSLGLIQTMETAHLADMSHSRTKEDMPRNRGRTSTERIGLYPKCSEPARTWLQSACVRSSAGVAGG